MAHHFCEDHVLHHTGGHLPRSHRRSRSSRGATSQPFGNVDPQGNSQASDTVEILPSPARIADTVPNITPEAITEAAAVEVRRLEGAVAALGEESPHAKPLLTALKAAKAKTQRPHQRPDRVYHTVFGTSQEEVGAGRSRGRESHSTEGPMCCRCGSSRTEVGAVASFSAVCDATRARGVGSVAKSHRRVDSRTGFSASFGDSRPRRGCSIFHRGGEHVESKRGQFRARACNAQSRGGPMSCKCRPIRVDVDFNRPRRHSGEGEWVVEPVQPVEAVTRESRCVASRTSEEGPSQEQIRGVVIR